PLVIWRALVRAGGSQPSACLSPRLRQRGRGGGPLLALRGETEQEERPHPSPGRTGIGPPVGSLDRLRATAGFERPNPGKDATTDPPSGFEDTSWTNIPTPLSTDGPSSQVTSRAWCPRTSNGGRSARRSRSGAGMPSSSIAGSRPAPGTSPPTYTTSSPTTATWSH